MKNIFKLSLATFLVVLCVAVPRASADVQDFVIHEFKGKYEVSNNEHGGIMKVTEDLNLTFSDNNHGIERAIPKTYKKESLRLKILDVERDGRDEPFSTYGLNGNEVLRIGDADKTVTGNHTYKIVYEMRNVMRFYEGYDEWYWDINGDGWGQTFEHVSGEVVFPAGWQDSADYPPRCYAGAFGLTAQGCEIAPTEHGYTFSSKQPLNAGETLSVVAVAPKGLFAPRNKMDWVKDNWLQIIFVVTGLIISLRVWRIWWRYGKDFKGRGVIIPEYMAPKGLTPAEVGLLMDYRVDGRDLTATLIDLAVRGYIQIHDIVKKKLGLFKTREFSLELKNNDFSKLKGHETKLLKAVFGSGASAGTIQKVSDINRSTMYDAVTKIRKELKTDLTKKYGLFEDSPSSVQAKLIVLGVGAFLAMTVFGYRWGLLVGGTLVLLSSALAAALLRRRSHAGVEAYDQVKGLRLYMNTAEAERLKMLQSVDSPYAEPAMTRKLYEKLLPFAVALGVERSWSKQFEGIYTQPPDWYTGNFSAFHMTHFAGSLSRGVSTMNSSFSAPSSSGSSGFSSGGGFSGGGGGGGGGGGW